MCGIFGHVGDGDEQKTFELGYYCEARGTDAGGLIWRNPRRDKFSTAKRPGAVSENVIPQYPFALSSPIVVGHTRLATSGRASDNRNNHPHVGERFLIVHNGHVWNDNEFACRSYCDSEAIVHALEQTPEAESSTVGCIEYAMRNLQGATTVAMVDRTDPSAVWVWRDDGNPLYTMKLGKAIYFASEAWMLDSIGDGKMVALEDYHAARLDSQRIKGKMMPIVARHPVAYPAYLYGDWGEDRTDRTAFYNQSSWDVDSSTWKLNKRGNPRVHTALQLVKNNDPWPDSKDYKAWHIQQYFDTLGCLDYRCHICHDAFGNRWKYAPPMLLTSSGVGIHQRNRCFVCTPEIPYYETHCRAYECGVDELCARCQAIENGERGECE